MIGLGLYNELQASHKTPQGWYFTDEEGTEVLLPNAEITPDLEQGVIRSLFCYLDHEERPVLSIKKPKVIRDHFGFLKIADRSKNGYFLDWGLQKQLFLPYRESSEDLEVGSSVFIYCYLDELSGRLVASKRWKRFIESITEPITPGTSFQAIVASRSDLGFECILEGKWLGLVYHDRDSAHLRIGDELTVYVIRQREDLKVDLSLHPVGLKALEKGAMSLLKLLEAEPKGFLPIHDKSSPDQIYALTQMSKKLFKKAVGGLLKSKKISIEATGIRLLQ